MALGARIALARRIAGISQRTLAAKAGVSAMAISKYEANKDTPGSGVLIRLAEALDVRVEFFLRPSRIHKMAPAFRKRETLPEGEQAAVMAKVQEWLERYLQTEELLQDEEHGFTVEFEWPKGFPYRITSNEDIERAAVCLRSVWELGQGPIENLTEVLEEQGIRVGLVKAHADFDACTFWVEAKCRVPMIAARDDLPGDRQRFSLAHELAHLLLCCPDDWSEDQKEKAAYRFSGAFLVPAEAARAELGRQRQRISLYELHILKHKYGASMQTWIWRAQQLDIVPPETAERMRQWFQQTGYRTAEPGDQIPAEEPTRLQRMVMHAVSEEVISEKRASELLGVAFSRFSEDFTNAHGLPVAMYH